MTPSPPEQQRASHEEGPIVVALLKASLVASLVFALAWMRWPPFTAVLKAAFYFLIFVVPFALVTLLLGVPLVQILLRFRAPNWAYVVMSAAVGASFGAMTSRPYVAPETPAYGADVPLENPHFLTVSPSPWTRDFPLDLGVRATQADYTGSILFCTLVGGSLGVAFMYFRTRRKAR